MKKSLIILGLLLCTSSVVLADEVVGTEQASPIEGLNTNNQIERPLNNGNFQSDNFKGQKPQFNQTNRPNFDKNTKANFKSNGQRPNFKKAQNPDFYGQKPPKFNGDKKAYKNQRPNEFRGQRPMPNQFAGHRPHRPGHYGAYSHHPQNMRAHNGYNPKMSKSHKLSKINLRKDNRRNAFAGKRPVSRRK